MPGDAPTLQIDGLAAPDGPNAPLLLDLIDVATAVYAKDKTTKRRFNSGRGRFRGRTISLAVPVRRLDFWRDGRVRAQVDDLVRAMTGDDVEINFTRATRAGFARTIFRSAPRPAADERSDAIVMLSGGLDSAAGALIEIVESRRHVVLLSQIQRNTGHEALAVVAALRRAAPRASVRHVTFSCDVKAKAREPAESTATFLRAAVAAVAADASGAKSIRFHTNGVASFALPLTDFENVTNRALAPTQPVLLKKIGELLVQVTGLPLVVENPFAAATKAEVIQRLGEHPRLVAATSSCERAAGRRHEAPFCGVCAHCLERRVAVLAAGMEEHDDAARYAVNPITGVREAGGDRVLGEAYVRRAQELANSTPEALALRFPQVFSWMNELGKGNPVGNASGIADLHRRHGREVGRALGISAPVYQEESLGSGCVLHMVRVSPKRRVTAREVHELVVDKDTVRLDGVTIISKRATEQYKVMRFLAERYREAYQDGKEPEQFPRFTANEIQSHIDGLPLNKEQPDVNARQYVKEIRKQLTKQMPDEWKEAWEREYGKAFDPTDIIDAADRKGFQLNPRKVKVSFTC